MTIPPGSRNIVHLHVSRTAGTSIQRVLNDGTRNYYHVEGRMWDLLQAREIDAGPAFTFTVVRHPLDRAMSCYGYTQNGVPESERLDIREWFMQRLQNRMNPIAQGTPGEIDLIEPQVQWLSGTLALCNRVYRYERLGALGLDLGQRQRTSHPHWATLDQNLLDLMVPFYRIDFDTFGYELP